MLLILVSIEIHRESWFFSSFSSSIDDVGCIEHKFVYTDCYTHVEENVALNAEQNNQPELACDYETQHNRIKWNEKKKCTTKSSTYTKEAIVFERCSFIVCFMSAPKGNESKTEHEENVQFFFLFCFRTHHSNNIWALVKWSRDDDRIPFFIRKTKNNKNTFANSIQRVYSEWVFSSFCIITTQRATKSGRNKKKMVV